jgi:hypothetical protein
LDSICLVIASILSTRSSLSVCRSSLFFTCVYLWENSSSLAWATSLSSRSFLASFILRSFI